MKKNNDFEAENSKRTFFDIKYYLNIYKITEQALKRFAVFRHRSKTFKNFNIKGSISQSLNKDQILKTIHQFKNEKTNFLCVIKTQFLPNRV